MKCFVNPENNRENSETLSKHFNKITSLRLIKFSPLLINLFISFQLSSMKKNECDVLSVYWTRTSKQSLLRPSENYRKLSRWVSLDNRLRACIVAI